jgi:hypothetical protein
MLHILHNGLLPYSLFDSPLSFHIEWIGIECRNFLRCFYMTSGLLEEFSEAGRVRLSCFGNFWLGLMTE